MSPYERVQSELANYFMVHEEADGVVRVTTHCMYPSNGFVQVVVHGGVNTFVVSDRGGALRELEGAGADVSNPDKLLRSLVTTHGLRIGNGVISSPQCSAETLAVAITLVANASKEAADWLFATLKIKRSKNFREVVAMYLRMKYEQHVRADTVVGASNKPHKFDNLILLPHGGRLIVDPVIPDASSINARVVANMDVRLAEHQGLEQRIVYDDEDEWRVEDLNLLQVGATVIPYSRANDVLNRMVGNYA